MYAPYPGDVSLALQPLGSSKGHLTPAVWGRAASSAAAGHGLSTLTGAKDPDPSSPGSSPSPSCGLGTLFKVTSGFLPFSELFCRIAGLWLSQKHTLLGHEAALLPWTHMVTSPLA